jgi:hypothetical protein
MTAKSIKGNSTEEIQSALQQSMADARPGGPDWAWGLVT